MQQNQTPGPVLARALEMIGAFYAFGAIVLLVALFTNPVEAMQTVALRHGLPPATGGWVAPAVIVLSLVIAYGLIAHKRWSLLLTLVYILYFGAASLLGVLGGAEQPFVGNLIWSAIVLVVVLLAWRVQHTTSTGKPS